MNYMYFQFCAHDVTVWVRHVLFSCSFPEPFIGVSMCLCTVLDFPMDKDMG